MEQNRLELIQTIGEQKTEHQRHIDEVKLEAENRLSTVQSNLVQTIEEQKTEHQRHIDEVKVEAENRLAMVRSNLETQLANQKVRNEAKEKERIASMANMNNEHKTFMAEMIRQQVELETVSSQRWQDKTNQITLIDLRLSKFNTKMEESSTLSLCC